MKNYAKKRTALEDAAYIFFAEEISLTNMYDSSPIENPFYYKNVRNFKPQEDLENLLQNPKNPESILIEKDNLSSLSTECLLLAKLILSLPEESFLINGKIKKTRLRNIIKRRTGWSCSKIDRVKNILANQLLEIGAY